LESRQWHGHRQVGHGDADPCPPSRGPPLLASHVIHKGLGGGHRCCPAVTVAVDVTLSRQTGQLCKQACAVSGDFDLMPVMIAATQCMQTMTLLLFLLDD